MIRKVLTLLGFTLLGAGPVSQAQTSAQAPGPIIRLGGKVTTLVWGDLTWHIPERLFFGVRTWTENKMENPKELWIQSWWAKRENIFSPHETSEHAIFLDIHVRKADSEDPRSALELIQRIHLPFTKVPILTSTQFNGMTYLGSSSSFHYFTLNNSHSFISCRLTTAARLRPPKVPLDVISRQFTCGTVFYLPRKTYAWVSISGVSINDTAPALNAAHRLLMSFIR